MGSSVSVDLFSLDQSPPLRGKIAIVAGCHSGIGYAVAKGFAQKTATAIIASQSLVKVSQVVTELRKETGNPSIHGEEMDLASFQ